MKRMRGFGEDLRVGLSLPTSEGTSSRIVSLQPGAGVSRLATSVPVAMTIAPPVMTVAVAETPPEAPVPLPTRVTRMPMIPAAEEAPVTAEPISRTVVTPPPAIIERTPDTAVAVIPPPEIRVTVAEPARTPAPDAPASFEVETISRRAMPMVSDTQTKVATIAPPPVIEVAAEEPYREPVTQRVTTIAPAPTIEAPPPTSSFEIERGGPSARPMPTSAAEAEEAIPVEQATTDLVVADAAPESRTGLYLAAAGVVAAGVLGTLYVRHKRRVKRRG